MKLPNPKQQVSYGLANAASWWMLLEGKRLVKCKDFWPFKNERSAAAAAKRLTGGFVVRRVTQTTYEVDR